MKSKRIVAWLAAGCLTLCSLWPAGVVSAAGSKRAAPSGAQQAGSAEASPYDQAVVAIGEQQYRRAIELLRQVVAASPDDADAHNLLGYCLRKNGDVDAAFASYAEALRLRPDFAEAREYLGEAHLQAALEQLRVLRSYGSRAAALTDRLEQAFDATVAEVDAASDLAPSERLPKARSADDRRW